MQFKKGIPIFRQIADYIGEQILLGYLKNGKRIPSVRDIAVKLEVNPNTVMRAYSFLQEEDIIYNKRGIGYYATDRASTQYKQIKRNEFISLKLPEIFKTLDLLNIQWDELRELYRTYQLNSRGDL